MEITDEVQEELDYNSIIVKNIHPSTNEQSLREIFSFCGVINFIEFIESEEGDASKTAILQFTNPKEAETALLLTDAPLNGNIIQVEFAEKNMIKETARTQKNEEISTEDTTPSKLATYLATGYEIRDTATNKFKSIDEKYNIVEKIQSKLDEAKTNIKNFDETYKISDHIKNLSHKTLNTTKGISEKLQTLERITTEKTNPWIQSLTSSLTLAFESAAGTGASLSEKHFGGIIETIKGFTQSLTDNFYNIEKEANEIYNARKMDQSTEISEVEKKDTENFNEDQEERELYPNDEGKKETDPLAI